MVDGPQQPADDDSAEAQQRRRLVWRRAGIGLLVLGLLAVLLLACVLWIPRWLYPSLTETDLQNVSDAAKVQELKGARLKLQNDARTTLLQGLGAVLVLTGAGIGASVTLRQVRATRDQIRETATASRNQLKLSERSQVTDRYTRAVEQLGHEKAPVRLGALYSLEHLAQDNPEYRQTVVDVVCAYLRMPYTPPAQTELDTAQAEEMAPPANGRNRALHPAPGRDPAREEFQVRQTAQRLLADHLRRPRGAYDHDAQLRPPSPQQPFWPGIRLDLTGATLVDFGFARVSVIDARFGGATFRGDAAFRGATFEGVAAVFREATFKGNAWFSGATFQGFAWFTDATFHGDAGFDSATFQRRAGFDRATFQGAAGFDKVTFQDAAVFNKATFRFTTWFTEATFIGGTWFNEAAFQGDTQFNKATFQRTAQFGNADFQSAVLFHGANFQGYTWFDEAAFQDIVGFGRATFQGAASFRRAQVLQLNDFDRRRVWPDGWTVRPDPADPSRGMLVPAEHAKEPEPAVPPSDPPDTGSGTG
jgi:uncharacterized protein YjbI with pentapeptide repeats